MELKDLVKYYVPMRMEGSSPPNWEVVFGYDISKFKGYNVDEVRVALNLTQLWLSQGPRAKSTAHIVHVGRLTERTTSASINFPIFMVRVGRRFEGVHMRPCRDPSGGIVCKWSQAIVF